MGARPQLALARAAVGLTAIFYRRMFCATWVAGRGAALCGGRRARATVGFIANRNVLVAATFGVSALIAHDRWRRDGSRIAAFLGPRCWPLPPCSRSEEGIGTYAYLGAYGLCLDPRGMRRGLLALWPSAVGGILWAVLRASWGYGVRDAGLYIDPLTDTSDTRRPPRAASRCSSSASGARFRRMSPSCWGLVPPPSPC